MNSESSLLIETKEGMKSAIAHLEELVKIRAGKASPSIFDGVKLTITAL